MSVGTHAQVAKVGVVTLALFASALPVRAAAQELLITGGFSRSDDRGSPADILSRCWQLLN